MSKSGSEDNFERNWQEAFENASVKPPSGIWNRVNQSLNSEELAKYRYQVKVYRFAAVIALFLAATAILFNSSNILLGETENLADAGVAQESNDFRSTTDLVKSIMEADSKLEASNQVAYVPVDRTKTIEDFGQELQFSPAFQPAMTFDRKTSDLLVLKFL